MTISTITTKRTGSNTFKNQKETWFKKRDKKVTFIEKGNDIIIKLIDKNYFKNLIGITSTEGKALKSLMEDKRIEREL